MMLFFLACWFRDSYELDDERSNNKMISNSREKGLQAKQEGDINEIRKLISKPPLSSSSRQWSGFRNPRVVQVSRSFGGKDRHSKVCTIRGIRDRRIRLSVPTAIQLYDLQDRLGLSQPSKVIDWLLDVTKHDIDKLPPLQIPQGLFGHHHQFHQHQHQQQQMMATLQSDTTSTSSLYPFFDGAGGIKINSTNVDNDNGDQDQSNKYWDLEASSLMKAKGKEIERGHEDKNAMPSINPYYYHWDPANLTLSQFGSSGHDQFVSQQQADQNALIYSNAFPSPSGSHHHHHLLFCPPAATMPSLFPTYAQEGTTNDHSSRQLINHHLQLWSSSSSSQHNNFMPINSLATSSSQLKPFSLNVNLGHAESNPDKEGT